MLSKPLIIGTNGNLEEMGRDTAPLSRLLMREHFDGTAIKNFISVVAAGGGGAAITANTDTLQGMFGAYRLRSGTAITGSALVHFGANMIRTGGIKGLHFLTTCGLSALSDSTNRFNFRAGFSTTPQTIGDGTGFYIRYTDTLNGGLFQGVVRNGATETTINIGAAPIANTPFTLGFFISQGFSSITFFYIDSSFNYFETTPVTLAGAFVPANNSLMGPFCSIQKNVGTTSRDCFLDYLEIGVI